MTTATLTALSSTFGTRTMADAQSVAAATAAHLFEAELMRPAPRAVRFTRAARGRFQWAVNAGVGVALGWVWLGSPRTTSAAGLFFVGLVLLLLCTAAILYDVWRNHEDAREWLANGAPVAGLVVERNHNATNSPRDYRVTFAFLPASGRVVARQEVRVCEAEYDALTRGTIVTLVCHPSVRDLARPYFTFTTVEVV